MTTASPHPQSSNTAQADRGELVFRIAQALPEDGSAEPQPGLHLVRSSSPHETIHTVLQPSFCVVAQGAKGVLVGKEYFRHDAAHYLVTTMGLPAKLEVLEASRRRPYLSLRIALDPATVTSTMIEAGVAAPRGDTSATAGFGVNLLDPELLNAILRLARLIPRSVEYRVLAPLIIRETIYRLLTGAQASRMLHLATFSGQAHRMSRAVAMVRQGFDRPLGVESLAKELGMSVSGFHAHFKAATNMSPIQFQKQIRLQEARRLMLSENLHAREAGYRVGYVDQSHFNRAYRQHFGDPPARDVERLRALTAKLQEARGSSLS